MLIGDQRTCDTCESTIPRGTPFRVGYTSKEAFDNSMKNATEATMPGHLVIEGRVVRFEICMKCWRSMGETELTPDVETDAVH